MNFLRPDLESGKKTDSDQLDNSQWKISSRNALHSRSASRTVLRWMMVWDRLGITKRFSFYVYWRILFVKKSKKRLSSRLSYSKVNGNPTVFSLLNSSSSNSLSAWAVARRFRWSVIICTHHSNWTSSPILTVLFWGLITNLGPRRIRNDISLDITPAEFDALQM